MSARWLVTHLRRPLRMQSQHSSSKSSTALMRWAHEAVVHKCTLHGVCLAPGSMFVLACQEPVLGMSCACHASLCSMSWVCGSCARHVGCHRVLFDAPAHVLRCAVLCCLQLPRILIEAVTSCSHKTMHYALLIGTMDLGAGPSPQHRPVLSWQ